jgi:hypothetical protein
MIILAMLVWYDDVADYVGVVKTTPTCVGLDRLRGWHCKGKKYKITAAEAVNCLVSWHDYEAFTAMRCIADACNVSMDELFKKIPERKCAQIGTSGF